MKVLVLDQFSEPGGGQQALLDLLPAFGEAGWDATVGMPGDGECFGRVRGLGFEAVRVEGAADIRRLAERADLVYVNGPRVLPAVVRAGVKREVVFHSHSRLGWGKRMVARWCLERLTARVVANCDFVARQWSGLAVEVVSNGVGAPSERRRPGEGPPYRVGCVGRIAREKGQKEFVGAARKMLRALPDCRFLIYGARLFSGGRYEAEVRKAARGLPVEFCGWTADVYAAMNGLDVLLAPSAAHEATTRVIPEAFAAGVPVVAFRSGGIPELIEHGVNGFLADSVEEMADTAVRVLTTDHEAVVRAARETWRRRFTLEIYRRGVMRILKSTAAAAASAAAPASTGA